EDAVDAAVAVRQLDGVVGREAVAAVDLQRLVDHEVEDLGAEHLDERELHGVLVERPELLGAAGLAGAGGVHGAGQAEGRALEGVRLGGHGAELLLDEPELGDGLAELLALLGVALRQADEVLDAPGGAHGELEAADVEDAEGDVVALADLAEQVLL